MKRATCVLAVALHLSACTSLTTMPYGSADSASNAVRVGDKIVVTTSSGKHPLEVTSASAEEVCGTGECIRADRIESVQREETSAWKTLGAVAVVVLAIGLFAALHGASFFPAPVFPL